MWFEQMHPAWQSALAPQRVLLEELESRLGDLPGLAPSKELVMAAFRSDPAEIRVVILGQDPYPTDGVAVGRSFAVSGLPLPASLRNIFRELDSDIGANFGDTGPSPDLAGWQNQGVFLLNRHLTTLSGNAGAHLKAGWEVFTDAALLHLARANPNLALVLWGKEAASIKAIFDFAGLAPVCFESVHPSPLSAHRGFFGSRPFSSINTYLQSQGLQPIDWKA